MVMKKSRKPHNIMQQYHHVSGKDIVSSSEQLQVQSSFLAYVQEFWLSHTAGFTQENTPMWELWKEIVLTEHPLAGKPWMTEKKASTEQFIMQYALKESHYALIACLLDTQTCGGPTIDTHDLLVMASGKGIAQVVAQVVEISLSLGDIAASDIDESLQAAAAGGHIEVLERLLVAKADFNNAADCGGGVHTVLHAAAEGGYTEVVERLLAANADVNADAARYYGRTALQAAAGGGHMEVVERLLAAKADVNDAGARNFGRTALQAAAGGGHMEVVKKLKQSEN